MAERDTCDYDAALRTEVFNRRRINAGMPPGIAPSTYHLKDCPHQIPKMMAEADAIEPPPGRIGAMPAQVSQEAINCAQVTEIPYPKTYGGMSKSPEQSLAIWLANVAYWMTYPEAPVQIPPAPHPAYFKWAPVWKRIYECVGKRLKPLPRPPYRPAKLKPRYVKFKPPGGKCWTEWTNGQLFKCCESEWVPGIGTAVACEQVGLPRPTLPPPAGVRRHARVVGRYGRGTRYDARYGRVGAFVRLEKSYDPAASGRRDFIWHSGQQQHRGDIDVMTFRPGAQRGLLRPQFQVDYQGAVGQLTGVRAGQARGAPLRRVVAECPPGTTRRADGACIPDPQKASECISMKTGPASSQSCCKKADGYWWCQDFAGNNYRPGIDAVKIPPGLTTVADANKQVRLGRMSFTDRRNARAAATCSPACKHGHVCVAGTCMPKLRDPWGGTKSKPSVRRRRGAFGGRR